MGGWGVAIMGAIAVGVQQLPPPPLARRGGSDGHGPGAPSTCQRPEMAYQHPSVDIVHKVCKWLISLDL